MTSMAILGGAGMLGFDLSKLAKKIFPVLQTYDLPSFDIRKDSDIRSALSGMDVAVNCAAYTDVDRAESEQEKCSEINALAPGRLAKIAKELGVFVIHVSTDFVYGDDGVAPLDEDVLPNPLNQYGKSKLEGERLLAESACDHAILRIEWTYSKRGNNFVGKIISLAKKNRAIKVVDDQFGSPTHTREAAKAILCLAQKRASGLFNFAADGYASRFDVAKFIVDRIGLDCEVMPCLSSDFATPAKRPENSRFNCSKIDALLDFERNNWRDEMAIVLDKWPSLPGL